MHGALRGILVAGGAAAAMAAASADEIPVARIDALNQALGGGAQRDPRSGYLRPVLDALGIPIESQLLVFSKTGAQRAYTSPLTPRALFFDTSAAVGYVPGAPAIEVAVHDPQQGIVFFTVDQTAATPAVTRRTSCETCHVSAGTLNQPGLIARSTTVGSDGDVVAPAETHDVDHRTPHPDRWGGWFVTSENGAAPYNQRAHGGNITVTGRGVTSNQVFVEWMGSAPESRGYPSAASDVVSLQVFDHQVHAINLLTALNRAAREYPPAVPALTKDLAEYLLFTREAVLPVTLTPRPGFAAYLLSQAPSDHRGRSLAEFDLVNRLFRYPCSYMIYSRAFDALPPDVKGAVYARMRELLTSPDAPGTYGRPTTADRRAVLEILHDTKPDFR